MEQEAQISSAAGKKRLKDRRTALLAEAARLGVHKLPARRQHAAELEDRRPGFVEAFRALFHEEGLSDLGRALAGLFSAVAHSTPFGLLDSVDRRSLVEDPLTGNLKAYLHVTSRSAGIVLRGSLLDYARAVDRAARLFGWTSEEWAVAHADALSSALFVANIAGRG